MIVNGEELAMIELNAPDIASLLNYYKLDSSRVAIEINGQVIKKSNYDSAILHDSDKIEIIYFVGGGR